MLWPLASLTDDFDGLSSNAVRLLGLEEVQQHVQQLRVFLVGLNHVARALNQLTQRPQRHLQGHIHAYLVT